MLHLDKEFDLPETAGNIPRLTRYTQQMVDDLSVTPLYRGHERPERRGVYLFEASEDSLFNHYPYLVTEVMSSVQTPQSRYRKFSRFAFTAHPEDENDRPVTLSTRPGMLELRVHEKEHLGLEPEKLASMVFRLLHQVQDASLDGVLLPDRKTQVSRIALSNVHADPTILSEMALTKVNEFNLDPEAAAFRVYGQGKYSLLDIKRTATYIALNTDWLPHALLTHDLMIERRELKLFSNNGISSNTSGFIEQAEAGVDGLIQHGNPLDLEDFSDRQSHNRFYTQVVHALSLATLEDAVMPSLDVKRIHQD